jgi:glycosyltransferase involved in cell wall biosynthesis/SAM-dependent methyltransferase
MHDTAFEIGQKFLEKYLVDRCPRILDVGSLNINGTLRDCVPPGSQYIGIDITAGAGVDVVLDNPYSFPFGDNHFDATIASSCFEHDQMFWLTFLEMVRVTKPAGYIYLNAPSNGFYHSHPLDNWRFYPDSGLALVAWAAHEGKNVTLIESFIARRKAEIWNDCVMVFGKGAVEPHALPKKLLADVVPNPFNIRSYNAHEVGNLNVNSEDMLLLSQGKQKLVAASAELDARKAEIAEEKRKLVAVMSELDARKAEIAEQRKDATRQRRELERALRQTESALQAVTTSTTWRVTAPARTILSYIPARARLAAKRSAKRSYVAFAYSLMPARIRSLRQRTARWANGRFALSQEPEIQPPLSPTIVDERKNERDAEVTAAIRNLRRHTTAKDAKPNCDLSFEKEKFSINPIHRIDERNLPSCRTPILSRYNRQRLETGKRFEFEPSLAGSIDHGPTISVLMPVYKTQLAFLQRAILSVLFQTYANWELIIVDDFSQRSDIEGLLNYYQSVDARIKVQFAVERSGISVTTNRALAAATGPYIALLDHDDMLTRDALERVAEQMAKADDVDLVYSDECKIDTDNLVHDLFYKPDWSPLLLNNFMYTGHLSVYRKSLVERLGGFRSEYDLSQDYDLALRVVELPPKVIHLDECLYGWRMITGSAATGDKPQARISNIAALQEAADRRGYGGVAIALPSSNRIKRRLEQPSPTVSIIVPSDTRSSILNTVGSIASNSTYQNFEVIVVTNSKIVSELAYELKLQNVRFVTYDRPFNFSDKCNSGASEAKGDYLIFLNDDVRIITQDWIETILEVATVPGVGGVSPKLIYENGTIQYAGMVVGVRRLVGTAFHTYLSQTAAYVNLAQSLREVSVLSGACLAISRRIFNEVGGWDSQNTPIAHSDLDLSFRIRALGYSCAYTPHAELTHIGHVAIGADKERTRAKPKTFKRDKADIFILKRWGQYCERDPYFPPKMRDLVYIDSQEEFLLETTRARVHPTTGKDFILFSHDLSASGAPRCLHEAAKVLLESGHYVLVMSPEDGPFRRRFIEIGADVIVDPLMLSGHETVLNLAKNFDIAICNTITCWPLPRQLAPHLPVYLHCHETELIRHLRDNVPGFRDGLAAATAIWAEGPLSAANMKEYCGLDAISIEQGVDELPEVTSEGHDEFEDQVVIALIGSYEPRKGQNLAVTGFKMLPREIQAKCRLVLAGRTLDPNFRSAMEESADHNPRIIFHNELDQLQVARLIRRADIVLVPSLDDAGPTTAIDALGANKILVTSNSTGVSHYLGDGESGFILRHNTAEEICTTLCRVLENRSRWHEIGATARTVYEAHFTRNRFKRQLFDALGLVPQLPKLRWRSADTQRVGSGVN